MQKFTGVNVAPRLTTFHTFGCPVYQLRTELQNGKKIPKWDPRCHVGLYLGNSPRHSRSVSNVLNLHSGRVSPQFHVQHDEFFETISSQTTTPAQWKMLAGFTKKNHQLKERSKHLPPPPPTSPILSPNTDSLPQDHQWPAEDHPPDPEPEPPDNPPQAD